ncbi:hypothetical protein MMC19_003332 [Ptychographa xylographoides]|nr:hypothetical protein [Ptychographa xylographoides]
MFGLILPSRPVLTPPQLQVISSTQSAYTFPSHPHFSHIVIFLLPGNELPLDTGAAVYIQFPGTSEFKLLGAIGMDKQSAIFKVHGTAVPSMTGNGMSNGAAEIDMDSDTTQPQLDSPIIQGDVVVGISIEPMASISVQLATLKTPPVESMSTALTIVKRPLPTKVLAQRIIKNAFNFLASFAGGPGGNEVVPLKSFQDWWAKFERRVQNDPGFLERDDDD